jgi:membrane protease YdiL (CAAX protease family)
VFGVVDNGYLHRYMQLHAGQFPELSVVLWRTNYFIVGAFVLVEMLAVLSIFRPISQPIRNQSGRGGRRVALENIGIGIVAGLCGFALMIPFWRATQAVLLIRHTFLSDDSSGFYGALVILLFGFLLPVTTELVFRGVAQNAFEAHMKPGAAMAASAVLFASLWYVFGSPFALVLGLVAAGLYRWKKSVLACIVANIVMTASGGVYIALGWGPRF